MATADPRNGAFDENSFDFRMTESRVHSDVLIASATFKSNGMAVPLRCTWYTKTDTDFDPI